MTSSMAPLQIFITKENGYCKAYAKALTSQMALMILGKKQRGQKGNQPRSSKNIQAIDVL